MVGVTNLSAKCPRCKRNNCYSWWESHAGESGLHCPNCGYEYKLVQVVDRKKTKELHIKEGISLKEEFPKVWKQTKKGKFIQKAYYYDEGQRKKREEVDFNKRTISISKEQILAKRMYLEGYKLKNIFAAVGVSLATICRWAKRYGWEVLYQKGYEKKLRTIDCDNYRVFYFKRSHRAPIKKESKKQLPCETEFKR